MKIALLAACCAPAVLVPLLAQEAAPRAPTADEAAVRAAIEDYVLAFYRAEPERLARALSPDVKKMGFWRESADQPYGDARHMTYDEAVALATRWNADGRYGDALEYAIVLHEVADQTATAKLTAYWGQDYMQLAKGPDGWRVCHILWQSAPPRGALQNHSAPPSGSLQAPSPPPATTPTPMQIRYLEIVARDVDATCTALERVHGVRFGPPIPELGGARTAPRGGGDRIGVRAPLRDTEEPVVRPYFLVEDIAAATDAAVAAGGELAHPPLELPGQGTFSIYFQGGAGLGLWQD